MDTCVMPLAAVLFQPPNKVVHSALLLVCGVHWCSATRCHQTTTRLMATRIRACSSTVTRQFFHSNSALENHLKESKWNSSKPQTTCASTCSGHPGTTATWATRAPAGLSTTRQHGTIDHQHTHGTQASLGRDLQDPKPTSASRPFGTPTGGRRDVTSK